MSKSMWQDEKFDYVMVGKVVFAFTRDLEQEKQEKRHKTAMERINRSNSFLRAFMVMFVTFDSLILLYLIGLAVK